ncbi:MAG: phytanoyl-CoA dioxygenase family protein, partial [Gammaproteobacteria bacterium]|nr:phytanoyl-CoA dioxygenase family protein [Gammaproteobacteria bacterium]
MQNEFETDGYYVLRGVLTEAEVDRLARPIRGAFTDGDYDTFQEDTAYPLPGIHSMGPRVLEAHPDIAELSLAHPAIVAAVEELFGEPATLAQYWSIMRPPGAGMGNKPFVKGSGAHYDYKPWRCVGSYVKWMFAVIPFVDYTETAGPLAIAPGSHRQTTILPSDGRVHQVDAALVPKPAEIKLVDPSLKKGDVVLMHGFSWHEARPNSGNSDRCGLYMKFHAKSSPPACGPTIYPSAVHESLHDEVKHLVPYHRGDGKYAALRDGPVGGVDEARLLIEDNEGRVLLLSDEPDVWRLPTFAASEDESAGILDVGNIMGSALKQTHAQL